MTFSVNRNSFASSVSDGESLTEGCSKTAKPLITEQQLNAALTGISN